jgi:hypothetical protein
MNGVLALSGADAVPQMAADSAVCAAPMPLFTLAADFTSQLGIVSGV